MDFISALREMGVPEEIEFDYTWLHVQGRYIVLYKVADPTASFSSVEHLCVSRQSLTDTELFQFEWVLIKVVKANTIIHDAAMMLASIAFSHAEYTEKIKSRD